jgi:hypothetical protein
MLGYATGLVAYEGVILFGVEKGFGDVDWGYR